VEEGGIDWDEDAASGSETELFGGGLAAASECEDCIDARPGDSSDVREDLPSRLEFHDIVTRCVGDLETSMMTLGYG
jgi:hypothetical protein